jgi:hypothetical protein
MTQNEFDDMPGYIIHLITDDRRHALCTGAEWKPPNPNLPGVRKFCDACRIKAMELAENK